MTFAKLPVTGVLLLDKPAGLSSQQAVSRVKYLLKSPRHDSKKAGHTGTLDPMATGLLPICFGESTKFAGFGLDADKAYEATIKLGSQTDSGDQAGHTIGKKSIMPFTQPDLDVIARALFGKQQQIPPMYSALKHGGKKLYELARQNIIIERPPRSITIAELKLHKIASDEVQMQVRCSKGTYVRTLGEAVAGRLGTLGHLTMLRRVATGNFSIGQAVTLADFAALDFADRLQKLLGVDCLLPHLPSLVLDASAIARLRLGQRLNVWDKVVPLPADGEQQALKLYDESGQFCGLALLLSDGKLQPKKMLARRN